jgi:hypothetical protein
LVHTPIVPGKAHDLQLPAQAEAQQTPCAQLPEPHSSLPEQNAPFGFGPHEPALQNPPEAQFASTVQAPKHRLPLQTKGAQGRGSGAVQAPVAPHVAAGVYRAPSQRSGAQTVVPGG